MSKIIDTINISEIYFEGKIYRQDEILSEVDRFSLFILENSMNTSPFVYLRAENHIKTVIAFLAILKAGKICVITEPHLKLLEIEMRLHDTYPVCSINIDRNTADFDYKKEVVFETNEFKIKIHSDLTDIVLMMYTAAEDGIPKAVMLTEDNLIANVDVSNSVGIVNPNSKVVALLPFYHIYGLINGFIHPALSGIPFLISEVPELKNAVKIFHEIKELEITIIHSVPLIYFYCCRISNIDALLKNVAFFFCGGIKLDGKVFDVFFKKTGKPIFEGYGLTEGTGTCATHRNGIEVKKGSVGIANKHCEFKIVNKYGDTLPENEIGEILIKGRNVMKGYFNQANYTNSILKDGWLKTGDYGKIDSDGYIYFEGLKKKMFNVAGSNVYPKELEKLITCNGFVEDVCVESLENSILGETVVANVTLKKNTLENQQCLKKWCEENISYYKIPKKWNFN